jgi:V-type H+-transporting ATPase subunit H
MLLIIPKYILSNACCSVIEQLGGKQLVMQLLGHEDPNVRYEALLAVQTLMVHNW